MPGPIDPTTNAAHAGSGFQNLVEIMQQLRAPGGCPWDREQTFDTIKPYLLEETYEVMDAIDARDWDGLADELGDLLLQAVFFAQMAQEAGHFNIIDSLNAINSKLVRRHPHVFSDGDAKTSGDVLQKWDEIKASEKAQQSKPKGLLGGVPRSLPSLVEAQKIAAKAAGVGFDWQNVNQVFDKMNEEVAELKDADARQNPEQIEDELGDLLFVVVNLARFMKVDPEQALRKTNAKFRRRFGHVEASITAAGKQLKESSIDEMEAHWQAAKQLGL